MNFTSEHLKNADTRNDLIKIAKKNGIPVQKTLDKLRYEAELKQLQIEMVNLQKWIAKKKKRLAIIFEGRDAAGKGGSIKRLKQHLNPRSSRVVALSKPTEVERGQWYFRRYIKVLPNPGEIVFFDRSWYNRAVVEPVMGFCNEEEYEQFIVQVPEFEHLLYEDNLIMIKFWFSISKDEQQERFESRLQNPLKQWKYSPVDMKGQELWDRYTYYKEQMFSKTHTNFSPWIIVKANSKKKARLESMRYILSKFNYEGKGESDTTLLPDPNIVMRYHRSATQIDI
ncbi:polyphosphate kinase 2 [Rhodohalobacter sulfatireducens]|uniref:ADP/GDP-polyphosphate phosphotransferase n=1 Tax=Rhodohalobacter sulfatireducens TaxID=2911366 RepID=A0ABS9KD88_9BACT|nr:polyphosphate kinase 2 [Rhodohalobacter sulfatireducens]MCG2588820.1 polyphosphate kinase 2 [Rhodohalobacter sulfatireducens]MDR9364293.1 polyphosphate kinase 2 [Balneolaceae bacterium]